MRDRYLQAADRVLRQAQSDESRGAIDRPCSECKWRGSYGGGGDYKCDNPLVALAASNQTDSYAQNRIGGVNEQRDVSSIYGEVVCGPSGVLFEKGQATASFFSRLGF